MSPGDQRLRLSHDLRTPLTIIAGYLEILEDPLLPAAQRKWLHGAAREAARELAAAIDEAIREPLHGPAAEEEMSWSCLG